MRAEDDDEPRPSGETPADDELELGPAEGVEAPEAIAPEPAPVAAPEPSVPPPPPPPPPAAPRMDPDAVPVFDTQNVLWHFGALAATVASIAVVAQVHPSARGFWILLVAVAFMAAYGAIAAVLLRAGWRIPGGIVAATAVSFVPVAGMGFERLIGVYGNGSRLQVDIVSGDVGSVATSGSSFQGHSLALALATAVAGLVVYAVVRYAFVFAWVAISMLIAIQLFLPAVTSSPSVADRADTFLATGAVFICVGLYMDLLGARRMAFWWHLVGLWALTIGFAYHAGFHSSPGWVVVVIVGIAVLAIAAPLGRSTWAVFGLLGTYAPVVHYAGAWFGNLGTAFVLVVAGFAIVAGGLAVQQAGDAYDGRLARRAAKA